MKLKHTAWTSEEDAALAKAVADKVSPERLSVRLKRSVTGIKRRIRELGLNGTSRDPQVAEVQSLVRAWLEACRNRDLVKLMCFYDTHATLECACTGPAVYAGLGAIEQYWQPKLLSSDPHGFILERARFDNDRVVVDYLNYEAMPVRMILTLDEHLKIIHSACGPRSCLKAAA